MSPPHARVEGAYLVPTLRPSARARSNPEFGNDQWRDKAADRSHERPEQPGDGRCDDGGRMWGEAKPQFVRCAFMVKKRGEQASGLQ